eukprot:Em0024g354a
MADMLPDTWQEDSQTRTDTHPLSCRLVCRAPIAEITLWLEGFARLALVLTSKHPTKAAEMWAYQSAIIRAARNYEGTAWVAYNRQYCREALARKYLNWSVVNSRLYSEAFTGRATVIPRCRYCLSETHDLRTCATAYPYIRDLMVLQSCTSLPPPNAELFKGGRTPLNLAAWEVALRRSGVVPKGHATGKWRLITDLSYPPGKSVNDGIVPSSVLSATPLSTTWLQQPQRPTSEFASDASGSWGCSAHTTESWFQMQWNEQLSPLSITIKELLPIMFTVVVWGKATHHDGERKPITKPRFIAQLRGYMKAAGLPSDQFAGHSFHIGSHHDSCKSGLGGGRGTPPGLGRTSSLGRVGTPTDGQCLVPHPQTEGEWPTNIKAQGSPS